MIRSRSLSRFVFWLALAGVLAVAGFFYWHRFTPTTTPDPQALYAITLAWEANGALENEEHPIGTNDHGETIFGYQQALPRLEEIRKRLPNEELAYRNLAIAWLMILKSPVVRETGVDDAEVSGFSVSKETAEREALAALEQLFEKFESPVSSYLYGVALEAFERSRAHQIEGITKYYEAAKKSRDHAPFWLATANTAILLFDANLPDAATLRPIITESLAELHRLEPTNLWVVRQTLDQMAIHQDDKLHDYWNTVRPLLERANFSTVNFLGSQEAHGSFGDYTREMSDIDNALASNEWPTIVRLVTGFSRSVNGKSPFVNDFVQLQPNPLDYLLRNYSDAVMQSAALAEVAENLLVPIQFVATELPPFVNRTPILDFARADVDFDGHLDLVVLRESSVEIFRGPVSSPSEASYLTIPLETKYRGIDAAYLGTVADATGSGVARRLSDAAGRPPGISPVELPKILLWGESGLTVLDLNWSVDSGLVAKPIEQSPSLPPLDIHRCILVDYDQDADLDILALTTQGLRLLMNRSNNTFVDASSWLHVPNDVAPIIDAQIVDWDRNVYIDILVQSSDGRIGLLENQRHGVFRYQSLDALIPADQPGFAVAEIDGNASWDLVSQQGRETVIQFSETKGWGKVQWIGSSPGNDPAAGSLRITGELMGAWQVGDFDNSGSRDFLLWFGGQLHFHPTRWLAPTLTQGARRIAVEPAKTSVALTNKPSRGEQGDFDADGDLDLLLLVDGKVVLLLNEGGNQNHGLTVVPLGRGDNASRANHLAIGSLFEARIGQQYFAETVTHSAVHVGLGKSTCPTVARIIWPNGIPQVLSLPRGKQTVEMLCISKGSCPFVYVWDGTEWKFLSDCLWAAPIGLQAPSGGLVPTRNWEYLRLPPESLGVADGTYRIMLTEELWEVAYFDHVRLQTVDHPEGIEIHINDKVGPPTIVEHRLYQVREKLPPRSAVDQTGRDVLPEIRHADQRFLRSFKQRIAQGYVEEHELILDFDASEIDKYTLFLTGWIQPTDTSINVMLQQHPELSGPVFPTMQVIGVDGQWQPVARPLGFPGGKTKTMAVPLAGLFPTNDHRMKIATSSEIYWDHVYLADTSVDGPVSEQVAELMSANSYFRGTTRRLPAAENGPELFDARDISFTSVWPPVHGTMPNHGNVLDRLTTADDRLVVLGSGDAVELQFKVPAQPIPPGYRRTFLLYTVGYDKDADLHTLEGQQVEPMPFAAMSAYPEYRAQSTDKSSRDQRRSQSWHRFWKQIQNSQIPHSTTEPKIAK